MQLKRDMEALRERQEHGGDGMGQHGKGGGGNVSESAVKRAESRLARRLGRRQVVDQEATARMGISCSYEGASGGTPNASICEVIRGFRGVGGEPGKVCRERCAW